MRCDAVMTCELETFREHDTVHHVARRMRDLDIGFAPVCAPDGTPLGTITDRDIAVRVCAEDLRPSATRAGDVMTRSPVTCREDEPIARAEALMARHQVARIMVVDRAGRLVGVISLSDVVGEEEDARAVETYRRVAGRDAHPGL
jgi:CBS domain-containing protein